MCVFLHSSDAETQEWYKRVPFQGTQPLQTKLLIRLLQGMYGSFVSADFRCPQNLVPISRVQLFSSCFLYLFFSLFVSHLSVSLGSALLCPPCGHLCVSLAPAAYYASGLLHPSVLLFLLLSPSSPLLDKCHCGAPCVGSFYYGNHTGVLGSSSCPHWAPITRRLDAFLL